MTNPSKSQITEVLTAIADLANVTAVNFLPAWTVFELETGDDRNYELAGIPPWHRGWPDGTISSR